MFKVVDRLYRGPRPDPQDIWSAGFTKVINLEWGYFDVFHDDDYEDFDWKQVGIEQIRIPMSDLFAPTKQRVCTVHEQIKTEIARGGKVYLHCLTGKDRTGFVVAAWRIREMGWSQEKAERECKAFGMHFWYYWWLPFLDKF